MATLRMLMSELDEFLAINSDDTVFDYRFYYQQIIQQRELSLRNEYNRGRVVHENVSQVLNCVPVEIVDGSLCCNGALTGCKLLRTVEEFPNTIELHQQNGILSIKPNTIFGKSIPLISPDRIPYLKPDSINNNLIYAFFWDKYLYLYSLNSKFLLIDSISVMAIFTDPIKAAEKRCSGNFCMTEDSEFPLNLWMWQSLVKPAILNNLMPKQMRQKDETNNSKDDSAEQQLNVKKQ